MKINIQAYWKADVNTIESFGGLVPEDILKTKPITVCDITINGVYHGAVMFDGTKLNIDETLKKPVKYQNPDL